MSEAKMVTIYIMRNITRIFTSCQKKWNLVFFFRQDLCTQILFSDQHTPPQI